MFRKILIILVFFVLVSSIPIWNLENSHFQNDMNQFSNASVLNDSNGKTIMGTSEWGQFHGNFTHNGYSSYSGPSAPGLLWNETIGSSTMNTLEAENGVLIANSVSSNRILDMNESDGKIIFTFQLPQAYLATSYAPAGGGNVYFESWTPGFFSDNIELSADSLSSGVNLWQTGIPGGSWSPLYGYDVETYMEGIVYRAPYDGSTLYAYNFESGIQSWSINLNNNIDEIPTGDGSEIVLTFSNNNSISAVSNSGKWLWNFTTDSIVSDVPVYSEGYFYFGTSSGFLYKISTNGSLIWKIAIGAGAIINSPTVANGGVYLGCANGFTYALNETTGGELWNYSEDSAITSSPVISDNSILYETDSSGNLVALNSTNGQLLWMYKTNGTVYSSPVLDHGFLFVVTSTGNVYAFGRTYSVIFSESGLPAGESWNVSINSINKSSNSNLLQFYLQNGSYSFIIGKVTGYSPTPSRGAVSVNGRDQNISISFSLGWSLPSAPQNLKATGSVGQIILGWQAPEENGAPPGFNGSGIESYYIYRSTSPGQEQYYGETNGSQLNYVDSSVSSGTIYFYVVTAVNPVGQSGFSNEASAQPVTFTVPTSPLNLTAKATSSSIILSWSPPVSSGGAPITGYIIYRGTNPGAEAVYQTLPPNETGYIDSSIAPGQTYYYYVIAENSAGQSAPSNTIIVVAPKNASSLPWYDVGFLATFGGLGPFIIIILTATGFLAGAIFGYGTYIHTRGLRKESRK